MFTTKRKGIIALLCAVFAAALIACAISLAPSASRTAPVYAAEGDLQITEIVDANDSSETYQTVEEAVVAGIKVIIDTAEDGSYKGYSSLYNAMWTSLTGRTLILLQDCETSYMKLSNNSIIDLNGHDLVYTGTATIPFNTSGITAAITDTSVSGTGRGGTLSITGEIDGSQSVFEIAGTTSATTLNVSNITINSTGSVFYPRGAAVLNITNCDITTSGVFCVSTNAGSQANYGVTINIAGSSLTADAEDYDDCAVMMNVSGLLNIENSVITGDRQGLFVRAGDATVVGSKISVTGKWAEGKGEGADQYYGDEAWQSGNEAPTAAFVIGNRNGTYFADANVSIDNSTISSPASVAAIYVDATSAPQGDAEVSYSSNVSISGAETSVTGSIVNNATDGDGKSIEIAVTGGTFTADVAEYIPEGTILTQDKSGKIVEDESKVESAAAEVNGVKYTTLQEAINNAGEGDTVTLLNKVTEDITIAAGQDITLDLNGNTLTNESDHTITNSGTLTITDTVGGGIVTSTVASKAAVYNAVGATATLNGGTYTRANTATWYVIANDGTMVLANVVAINENSSDPSSLIINNWSYGTNATPAKLTIISGTYTCAGGNVIKNDEGGSTVTINDGTFTSSSGANSAVQNWSNLTINGGIFENTGVNGTALHVAVYGDQTNNTIINDGNFIADNAVLLDNGYGVGYGTGAIEFEIADGTFDGAVREKLGYALLPTDTSEITGGMYTEPVAEHLIASGSVLYTTDGESFAVASNEEAMKAGVKVTIDGVGYTEIPESVVATVGAEGEVPAGYETLQEAITAAADGDTVTLISGVNVSGNALYFSGDQALDKAITLDLNGHDIVASSSAVWVETSEDFTITSSSGRGSISGTYGVTILSTGAAINVTIENTDIIATNGRGIQLAGSSTNVMNAVLNNITVDADENILSAGGVACGIFIQYSEATIKDSNIDLDYTYSDDALDANGNPPQGTGVYIRESNASIENTNIISSDSGVVVLGYYGSDSSAAMADETYSNYHTIDIKDSNVEAETFALSGNGASHGTVFNISNSTLTSNAAAAIYHPQYGELNILGSENVITGTTGIEIRAGVLNVEGGTITGNGDPFEADPNGNGTTTTGAAIAIVQHTTKLPIDININGGEFNGVRAIYEANLQENSAEDVAKIVMEVAGGTFNGEVYSEDVVDFITGGSFKVLPDEEYLSGDFNSFALYDGYYMPVTSATEGTMLEEIEQIRQEIDAAIDEVNGALAGSDATTLADAVTALIGKMNELEDKIAELDENMVTDADLQALRNSITVAYNAAVSRVRAELSAQISDLRDSMAEMGDVSGQLDELKAAYEAADALLNADIDSVSAALAELESTYKAADDAIWNAIYALRDADSGMTTALWVIGVIAVLALCAGVAGVAFAIVRTKRS